MDYYFSLMYCLSTLSGIAAESYVSYIKRKLKYVPGDLRKVMEFYVSYHEEQRSFPEFVFALDRFGFDRSVFNYASFQSIYSDAEMGLRILWGKFTGEVDSMELAEIESSLMAETDNDAKKKLLAEYTRKLMSSSSNVVSQVVVDSDIVLDLIGDDDGQEGLVWPVEHLNTELGRVAPGQNVVLLGAPGSFKTTFALNMVFLNSVMREYKCAYLYLEDLPLAYHKRIISRYSRSIGDPISTALLNQGTKDRQIQERVTAIEAKYKAQSCSRIHYIPVSGFSTEPHIFATQFGKYIDENKIDYVVLDYAQRLKVYAPGLGYEMSYLNLFISTLNSMSLGVMHCRKFAMVHLSQMTKEAIKRVEKSRGKASISDASEINALERDAHFMLSLYADDDLKSGKLMRYQILKARNGKTYENPSEIPCDPTNAYIGDVSDLGNTFSVSSMANVYDNFAGIDL